MHWEFFLLVGIALMIAEMTMGTFYLLVMGLAFVIAAGWDALFKTGWIADIMVVVVFSLAGFALIYKRGKVTRKTDVDPRLDLNENIGAGATVRRRLPNGNYELNFRGTTWTGSLSQEMLKNGIQLNEGDSCVIVDQRGNSLVVEPKTKREEAEVEMETAVTH